MESSWIILIASSVVLFFVAYTALHFYVLRGLKVKLVASLLFSGTFACSGAMLEMFLLELTTYRLQEAEWTLILTMFSFLMLAVIPALTLFMLFKRWRLRVMLTLAGLIFEAFVIQWSWEMIQEFMLGCDAACRERTYPGMFLFTSLVEQVRLLGVSGMMLSAILSGFGAVNSTYNYFNFFSLELSQGDLDILEQQYIVNDRELTELKAKIQPSEPKSKGMFGWSLWQNDSEDNIAAELRALEAIHQEYEENIQDIIVNREREKLSHTFKGKIYSVWARCLLVYCVYKLVFATINSIFRRKYSIDPVSRSLIVLGWFIEISPTFREFVSSQVSFMFIGILIVSNFRSFFYILASFIRSFGKLLSSGISTETFLVLASAAMGSYFLATVLLMRANMPVESRQGISNALDGLDFFTFHHIFDATFAVSSLTSAVVLYL
eukprot:CAMPEP_0204916248 /NCGR_PEP_ID=MMETSP1397-20131031/14112_1 /ASSEMBLY_ACC=CAM_ASM_000891 /TAXON_ID=49980 /ORGANISM="Climacostomum Climacostomum virens, Strain Stock W-24" /LENGTH=435 /DNA_ID=CAMNT_0052088687 /DNA_START=577 /DNA_END=1881 /DNA_ORIENTATION=+